MEETKSSSLIEKSLNQHESSSSSDFENHPLEISNDEAIIRETVNRFVEEYIVSKSMFTDKNNGYDE